MIEFIEFALQRGQQIVEHERVRSIALSPDLYEASQRRYAQRVTGTVYLSPDDTHRSLADLYLGREE